MAGKRIFYCINHQTLISNEVNLLTRLGCEVYIPKALPFSPNDATSAEILFDYDLGLTICAEDLSVLNTHNFYETPINQAIAEIINSNFDLIITAGYPIPITSFLELSSLPVGIRVFGLQDNYSYSKDVYNSKIKNLILNRRCKFFAAYSHLDEVETDFKDLFCYAPVTCEPSPHYIQRSVTRKFLLFQCSRININPYYTAKIEKFLSEFDRGDIDYSIYGSIFSHPNNLGRPTDEEVHQLFSTYSVMYYDSQEPRHLHYHPLEAMWAQMPVVFLERGMLGRLLPNSPGKSSNVDEAKIKIKRIISGDPALEKEICEQQNLFLDTMTIKQSIEKWKCLLEDTLGVANQK